MAPAVETERKRPGLFDRITSDSVTSRALAVLQACSSSSSSSDEEDDKRWARVRESMRLNRPRTSGRLSKNSLSQESQNHTESGTPTISNDVRGTLKGHQNYETGGAVDNLSQRTEPQLLTEGEREKLHYNAYNLNEDSRSNFTRNNEINSQRPSPTSTNVSMVGPNHLASASISTKRRRIGRKNQSTAERSSRVTSAASSRSPGKNSPSNLARAAERAVDSPQKEWNQKAYLSSLAMQQRYVNYDVEDICPHDLGSEYGDILSSFLCTPFDSRAMKSLYQYKEFNRDDGETKTRYECELRIMSQRQFLNMTKDMLADEAENKLLDQIEASIELHSSKNVNS
ncbi:hypothetical protein HJC23_005105 [Cyclotella cryptica]|uniref:Uncharacterized protein n=1 Tax=Cyclotella cryptica TaxID=29204 RepID=A0ABD3QHD9_9STRA|eukprot:CCRYP_005788-RA/>CCRYP_005788-RA protein AED:0.15 eAED:0.15 QI:0/-1/0/1/-1/1/1/0/341